MTRPSTFGAAFGPGPGWVRSISVIAEPDEPTVEEIARAANETFVPLRHLPAYRAAKAAKRALLVREGRAISANPAHSDATLMALAAIVRIGTGRL